MMKYQYPMSSSNVTSAEDDEKEEMRWERRDEMRKTRWDEKEEFTLFDI